MTYLLDTCVISEYVRKKPNTHVIQWIDDQDESKLFLSVLTIGELKKGIIKIENNNPTRYEKLLKWLKTIENRFSGRVLSIGSQTISIWAECCGISEAKGTKLPIIDSLLSATAQEHALTIVTRNVDDFRFFSANTFNPWEIQDLPE